MSYLKSCMETLPSMSMMVALLLSISVESPSIATDHYILHPVDLTDIKSMRLFISQFITNKEYRL